MERLKNNCVSGPFFYSISRHCPKIESLAPPVARRGAPPTPQGGPVGPARRGHGVDVALDRAERRIGLGSIWIAHAWMPCGSGRMDRTQKKGAGTWNVSSHSLWASARSAMAV